MAAVADVSGRVVSVVDGDTLTVLVNERQPVTVKLLGTDAPERQQEVGRRAQSQLSALTYGKEVRVEGERKDASGRLVGKVWVGEGNCAAANCPRGIDPGLALVAAGLAWHDSREKENQSREDRERYAQAEFMAKVRRLGLWGRNSPLPPWARQRYGLEE